MNAERCLVSNSSFITVWFIFQYTYVQVIFELGVTETRQSGHTAIWWFLKNFSRSVEGLTFNAEFCLALNFSSSTTAWFIFKYTTCSGEIQAMGQRDIHSLGVLKRISFVLLNSQS